MSLEAIKSLISEFGLSLTISAIAILFAIRFIKNTLNQNNQLMKMLISERQNSNHMSQEKHKELIDLRLEVNNKVKSVIEDFRRETDSDRIYIFEYHNGESNMNGLPFAKVSATYEMLRPGVLSHKARLQGIPSGLILEFNQVILTEEKLSVRCIEEYKAKDAIGYSVLMRPDVKSFYVSIILNAKGYPIGFIGMDYIGKESTEEQSVKAMKMLQNCSLRIGTLLEIDSIQYNKKED